MGLQLRSNIVQAQCHTIAFERTIMQLPWQQKMWPLTDAPHSILNNLAQWHLCKIYTCMHVIISSWALVDSWRMAKNTSRLILTCLVLTAVRGILLRNHIAEFEECLTSFSEFERLAIRDNSENKAALSKAFYRTNSPFPLSVRIIYRTNSSIGECNIVSTDPSCAPEKEVWLWVPSPIYILVHPTKLNLYALYTLNYFMEWTPESTITYVPNICNISHNHFNFLNGLTMKVSAMFMLYIT